MVWAFEQTVLRAKLGITSSAHCTLLTRNALLCSRQGTWVSTPFLLWFQTYTPQYATFMRIKYSLCSRNFRWRLHGSILQSQFLVQNEQPGLGRMEAGTWREVSDRVHQGICTHVSRKTHPQVVQVRSYEQTKGLDTKTVTTSRLNRKFRYKRQLARPRCHSLVNQERTNLSVKLYMHFYSLDDPRNSNIFSQFHG